MRILYFSPDYTPHDFRFLKAMLDNGFEVWYMHPGISNHYEPRPVPEEIHIVDWLLMENTDPVLSKEETVIAELKRVFSELKPDVVHSGPLTTASYLVAKAGLHPHCAMSWGFDLGREIEQDETLRKNAAFSLSQADWMLGDCMMELDTAERLFGYAGERATIFPWGIDTVKFSPDPAAKNSELRKQMTPNGETLFLSTRTMESNYSVETTVKAFLAAVKEEPAMRLVLLGDGSQRQYLEELAENDPDGDKVTFLGRQPNPKLVDFYRLADHYVTASIVDGSSVSLLEAMGCGAQVIASDIPGNREWVVDGVSGLFFETKNEEALKNIMLYVVRHPEESAKMAETARSVIEERADWEKNKFRLKEAYNGAMNR